jgi:hypothetical protein
MVAAHRVDSSVRLPWWTVQRARTVKTWRDIRESVAECATFLRSVRRTLAATLEARAEAARGEAEARADILAAMPDANAFLAEALRLLPDNRDASRFATSTLPYPQSESAAFRRLHLAARTVYADAWRAEVPRRVAAEREARAEREAAERARFPDADTARRVWRETGDRSGFHLWREAERNPDGSDMLRVDGADVRTGRDASAPLREALAAFRFIAAKVAAGAVPWTPSGCAGATAGGFALAEIHADGSARFGCHTFNLAEMRAAAESVA